MRETVTELSAKETLLQALREKWDRRYRAAEATRPGAARVLSENLHLLPASGKALDLACGRGGNALLLATTDLQIQAWDLSTVGIEHLATMAQQESLAIDTAVRDVISEPPTVGSFDVIVVSYFLERSLSPLLCSALRPGGLLFYQTFVRDRLGSGGPSNVDFLLAENELLSLFSSLILRVYREEGSIGDAAQGFRNEAMLVAQRPYS